MTCRRASVLALLLLVAASGVARAEVVIPHLGRLMRADTGADVPVTGTQKLKFGLYKRSVDGAGENNLVWEDTYDAVEFSAGGLYHVDLGDQVPITQDDVAGNPSLWLQVTVYDAGAGTPLAPRMRLEASALAHWAGDAGKLGGNAPDYYLAKADFDDFKTSLTGGGTGGLSVPWTKVSEVPAGLQSLADVNASDLARKADLDGLRTALTGAVDGTSVPWSKLSGVPGSIATALQQVTTANVALSGNGTPADPLRLKDGGIDTTQLKDGAVTAAKLQAGAITPSIFEDKSIAALKLTPCGEGKILKVSNGVFACGDDVGGTNSIPFTLQAPLTQITGTPPTLLIDDKGIQAGKLADAAVDATKLKADAGSLAKVSGGAALATATGAVGIGVAAPTARLELAAFDAAGTPGAGTITYNAGSTSVANSQTFVGQVAPGDLVQLGNLGWKTVTAIGTTSLTLDASYASGWGGNFTIRRATMHVASLHQSGLGNIGIGTVAPLAPLDLFGATNALRLTSGSDQTGTRHGVEFYGSSGNAEARIVSGNFGGYNGGLDFQVHNGGATAGTATASAMFITNAGDVGIGTTTPASELDVNGSLTVRGELSAACLARTLRYEATCLAQAAGGSAEVAIVSPKSSNATGANGTALCNSYKGNNNVTGWSCLSVPYVYDSADNWGDDVRPTWSSCGTNHGTTYDSYEWFDKKACTGVMMACCVHN